MIPRFTKTWDVDWNGREIRIENWWNPLLQSGERMLVDGVVVAQHEGWFGLSRDLEAEIQDGGSTRTVRAHIGSIDLGSRVGCVVFVDEVAVGGDTERRFLT